MSSSGIIVILDSDQFSAWVHLGLLPGTFDLFCLVGEPVSPKLSEHRLHFLLRSLIQQPGKGDCKLIQVQLRVRLREDTWVGCHADKVRPQHQGCDGREKPEMHPGAPIPTRVIKSKGHRNQVGLQSEKVDQPHDQDPRGVLHEPFRILINVVTFLWPSGAFLPSILVQQVMMILALFFH